LIKRPELHPINIVPAVTLIRQNRPQRYGCVLRQRRQRRNQFCDRHRLAPGDLSELDPAPAKGLEAVQRSSYDLILMDMQMPVMDGLSATRAIRAFEQDCGHPRTPIIMLSANAWAEHIEASFEAGADAHLSKPITADTLLAAIDSTLTNSALAPSPVDRGLAWRLRDALGQAVQIPWAGSLDISPNRFLSRLHVQKDLQSAQRRR